jgi:hypothetical protein
METHMDKRDRLKEDVDETLQALEYKIFADLEQVLSDLQVIIKQQLPLPVFTEKFALLLAKERELAFLSSLEVAHEIVARMILDMLATLSEQSEKLN